METELEAKFTDIDPKALRKKLAAVGATLVHPERFMRRKNFDFPDRRLEKEAAWIRVRDEGDKITVSYKKLVERSLHGMKEISFTVSDFEAACNLFIAIGLMPKAYQETKRERWQHKGVEITIDTWPWIPTFVELEAEAEAELREAAELLELNLNKASHGSVEAVYEDVYDVTDEDVFNWQEIRFGPVPDWLEVKRKKR